MIPVDSPSLRTVGATRSAFEREYEATEADPMADLGDPDEGGVVLAERIGEGGMGLVRAGVQTVLGRRVAVKRPILTDGEDARVPYLAFLREAWITANLEHPNIIPVHTLASDHGDPRLVLKLVEGVSWRELLEDDVIAVEHGMRDRLAFHLEVFGRVCRAVHFAHTQGVVHLDLKPANVMVGRHGEVYLLDWGIAAGFGEQLAPFVPRTTDIVDVRGTPAYMSPEQARGLGSAIGPRTDVFLLGALIHRIVVGHPPHRGDRAERVMDQARRFRPTAYPADVPSELAAIAQRAMARTPDDRYASAEELRLAVEGFLRHRHSGALLDAATSRLASLREAAESGADRRVEASTLARLANECRFGIEEALHSWPENPAAKQARAELTGIEVRLALREGDWRAAAAALERLEAGGEALWEEVRALRANERERERKRKALEDLGSHQDLLRNARTRSIVAIVVIATWVVWFALVALAIRSGWVELSHRWLAFNSIGSLAFYALVLFRVRHTMLATRIDRRVAMLLLASLGGVAVLWGLCAVMGIAPMHAIAISSGVYAFFSVGVTMVLERRFAWIAPLLGALAFGSFLDLRHALEWQSATVLLGGSALALLWQRDARRAARRAEEARDAAPRASR